MGLGDDSMAKMTQQLLFQRTWVQVPAPHGTNKCKSGFWGSDTIFWTMWALRASNKQTLHAAKHQYT